MGWRRKHLRWPPNHRLWQRVRPACRPPHHVLRRLPRLWEHPARQDLLLLWRALPQMLQQRLRMHWLLHVTLRLLPQQCVYLPQPSRHQHLVGAVHQQSLNLHRLPRRLNPEYQPLTLVW